MKKSLKSLICVVTTLIVCLFSTSCMDLFASTGTNGGQTNSVPKTEGVQMDFDINVTNSLDIVPDGVAVLDYIRPSVVEVYTLLQGGKSSGSGVVLSMTDSDEDGEFDKAIIVTCHHVIEGGYEIIVKAIDGREYNASIVGSDPDSDIGVLYIEATEDNKFENLNYATWYDRSSDLKVGTEVYAIGNPLGTLGGTVTSGIISAINRDVNVQGKKMTLIQTDAAINGGNSGGGLFDKGTGALVGIVNAGYASSTAEGLNFAIPGSQAIDIIEQIISNGYIEGRYDFGVEFAIYQVSVNFWSSEYYVGISALEEYGMFINNGFAVKDVILSVQIGNREKFTIPTINNTNVDTVIDELNDYLDNENCQIGDKVTVEYRRYTSGTNYVDKTTTFEITQYVYGK